MATEVVMPSLAPSMTEGRVGNWLKQVGEEVRAGEALAEIESEKTVSELEAPTDGYLLEIVVAAQSDEVAVGTVLARIGNERPATVEPRGAVAVSVEAPVDEVSTPASARPLAAAPPKPVSTRPASPFAARVARLLDLDLHSKAGSGEQGRLLLRDLGLTPLARLPVARRVSRPTPGPGAPAPAPVPHSAYRRIAARRLTEAKQRIPHFYLQVDVQVDRLLALRAEYNTAAASGSPKVSINDCVVRAVARALALHPSANVTWSDDGMLPNAGIDVAFAVATPLGLVTPVLRGADALGLPDIARHTQALAARARANALTPEEYQGGSCTISNLGMYGVDALLPILNPPQSFILGVGRVRQVPVVRDGAVVPGRTMSCTLSGDHRAIDGATGAQLLDAVLRLLEAPLALFLTE